MSDTFEIFDLYRVFILSILILFTGLLDIVVSFGDEILREFSKPLFLNEVVLSLD